MKKGWKKKTSKYIDILPPYVKKCPECGSDMKYNAKASLVYSIRDNKMCHGCANKGKNLGRKHKKYFRTPENKKNNRLAAIKRIEKNKLAGNQFYPSFNHVACNVIENYGKENGYDFNHAKNGGEFHIKQLGYWVDGYDKEKNVVIECYEKHHYIRGKLREKDVLRQKEIKQHLGCKFIIYNFNNRKFYEI